jgi:hypothetical protein
MWGRVRKAVRILDPVRIENRCEKGTPDVNLSNGVWIELKWCRKAPKRGGILRLAHDYMTEQRTWAIRRIHAGGKVFVLLKVANEWFLFKGDIAAEYLGYSTIEKLKEVAVRTWKKLNDQELLEALTQN